MRRAIYVKSGLDVLPLRGTGNAGHSRAQQAELRTAVCQEACLLCCELRGIAGTECAGLAPAADLRAAKHGHRRIMSPTLQPSDVSGHANSIATLTRFMQAISVAAACTAYAADERMKATKTCPTSA